MKRPTLRRPRWLTRPVAVAAAVLIGLGGLGGATGAVLGGIGAGSSGHHHEGGPGHHRLLDRDDAPGPGGPFRR